MNDTLYAILNKSENATLQYLIFCEKVLDEKYLLKITCVALLYKKTVLLYTYKKYPLILPIFLHKNTKSCITPLAFSDSVSPSSIFYPRRTTWYCIWVKPTNRPECESNINDVMFCTVLF